MLLRLTVTVMLTGMAARDALAKRVNVRDERGEVTSTTIMIAILAALALAVGAIITAKVLNKANSTPTE